MANGVKNALDAAVTSAEVALENLRLAHQAACAQHPVLGICLRQQIKNQHDVVCVLRELNSVLT